MNRQLVFTALAAAIGLGAAPQVSKATERYFGPSGYQVQTWQDIEQDRLDIQRQIQKEYHLGNAGVEAPPKPVHRGLRKQAQEHY
jgi:hypothetical protein